MQLQSFPQQQATATLQGIPSGKAGTVETLRIMRSLVREYKKSLPVRFTALQLVEQLPQKDYGAEMRVIHRFVRDTIRYVRDINGVETIQTPVQTLQIGQGDCDDKATLICALLESIGHPTRFVAVGFAPDDFAHVYAETKIGAIWVSLETTEPVEPGWQPEGVVSRLVIHN